MSEHLDEKTYTKEDLEFVTNHLIPSSTVEICNMKTEKKAVIEVEIGDVIKYTIEVRADLQKVLNYLDSFLYELASRDLPSQPDVFVLEALSTPPVDIVANGINAISKAFAWREG